MDAPKLSATEAEQMIAIIPDAPPVMQVNLHRPPTKSPTFCARDAKSFKQDSADHAAFDV
jgi:hypothetical protein